MRGMIYFLQGKEGTPIKIGYTLNEDTLRVRISSLQTGYPYPLRVIWKIETGSQQEERSIHRALSADRLLGEWFEFSPRVELFIKCVWRGTELAEAIADFKERAAEVEGSLSNETLALYESHIEPVFGYPHHKIAEARRYGA